MIDIFIPLFALIGLFFPSVAPEVAEGKSVDYRYAQSAVRSLPVGPKSPAYAVCDMMETFTGVPLQLDAEALRAHEQARGEAGSLALYYQYLLERQGILRQESDMDSTNQKEFTRYLCPTGSVLSFSDAIQDQRTGKNCFLSQRRHQRHRGHLRLLPQRMGKIQRNSSLEAKKTPSKGSTHRFDRRLPRQQFHFQEFLGT